MKKVMKRENKGYTSIIVKEISLGAFTEAKNIYETINGNKVIKLSAPAQKEFFGMHSLRIGELELGDEIGLLGTTFKVVKSPCDDSLKWVEFYGRDIVDSQNETRKLQKFGLFATDNSIFAITVIDQCFYNHTGILLGY